VGTPDLAGPTRRRAQAVSFGPAADTYDAVRPAYPPSCVEWLFAPLGPGRWRMADVGAGTGILTRSLVECGYDVVAVEPDELMRAALAARTPGAEVRPGSAEDLPLADGELDAVVAAQAYHWFDQHRANAEFRRVVRPGGLAGAVWNLRDETVDWVAEYTRIVDADRTADSGSGGLDTETVTSFGDGFAPVEAAEFRHEVTHTPDTLVELMRSRSYYLAASPARRAVLEAELRDLARTHPALAGRERFPLPYLTRAFRAVRR
jgi:SAM-dependent methyltransferase